MGGLSNTLEQELAISTNPQINIFMLLRLMVSSF